MKVIPGDKMSGNERKLTLWMFSFATEELLTVCVKSIKKALKQKNSFENNKK